MLYVISAQLGVCMCICMCPIIFFAVVGSCWYCMLERDQRNLHNVEKSKQTIVRFDSCFNVSCITIRFARFFLFRSAKDLYVFVLKSRRMVLIKFKVLSMLDIHFHRRNQRDWIDDSKIVWPEIFSFLNFTKIFWNGQSSYCTARS